MPPPVTVVETYEESREITEARDAWLSFDAVLLPNHVGFDVTPEVERTIVDLPVLPPILVEGRTWSDTCDLPGHGACDLASYGYHVAATLSERVGPVRVGITVAAGKNENRWSTGKYREQKIFVRKDWPLSGLRKVWLELSAGRRYWIAEESKPPPAGEEDSLQVLLTFGFTF